MEIAAESEDYFGGCHAAYDYQIVPKRFEPALKHCRFQRSKPLQRFTADSSTLIRLFILNTPSVLIVGRFVADRQANDESVVLAHLFGSETAAATKAGGVGSSATEMDDKSDARHGHGQRCQAAQSREEVQSPNWTVPVFPHCHLRQRIRSPAPRAALVRLSGFICRDPDEGRRMLRVFSAGCVRYR